MIIHGERSANPVLTKVLEEWDYHRLAFAVSKEIVMGGGWPDVAEDVIGNSIEDMRMAETALALALCIVKKAIALAPDC